MTPSWPSAAAVVTAAFAFAGCSFFMSTPPTMAATASVEVACDDSNGAPILDTVGAVLSGIPAVLLTVVAISDPTGCTIPVVVDWWFDPPLGGQVCTENVAAELFTTAAIFAVPTLIYGIAAGYGYRTASRCRTARRDHQKAERQRRWDFFDFARTAYPGTPFTVDDEEWRCDLKPRVAGREAHVAGTVYKGAEALAVEARFTPVAEGWSCDWVRSRASVIGTGEPYNACRVLDEACRGGPR